ncbi:MAG: hypothetical protein ACOWWO_13060 [Peptococcaceae bacterium]
MSRHYLENNSSGMIPQVYLLAGDAYHQLGEPHLIETTWPESIKELIKNKQTLRLNPDFQDPRLNEFADLAPKSI